MFFSIWNRICIFFGVDVMYLDFSDFEVLFIVVVVVSNDWFDLG